MKNLSYDEIETAIRAMQKGTLSVDDALHAGRLDLKSARTLSLMYLNAPENETLLFDSGAGRTIDFLWKLDRPHSFLITPFSGQIATLAVHYLESELRERPEQFSDDDLRFIATTPGFGPHATGLAEHIKTNRVKDKLGRG